MEIYANEEHHWNVIDDHLKNGKAVKIWWHKMVLTVYVTEILNIFSTLKSKIGSLVSFYM